jgi:hypothetical protein
MTAFPGAATLRGRGTRRQGLVRSRREAEVAVEQEIESQKGPLEAFRERRISLATMDGLLLVVTVAQPAVAAIFVTIRDSSIPTLVIYVVKGELVSMPIPTFVAAIFLFSLSWAYLLSGISHGRMAVKGGRSRSNS